VVEEREGFFVNGGVAVCQWWPIRITNFHKYDLAARFRNAEDREMEARTLYFKAMILKIRGDSGDLEEAFDTCVKSLTTFPSEPIIPKLRQLASECWHQMKLTARPFARLSDHPLGYQLSLSEEYFKYCGCFNEDEAVQPWEEFQDFKTVRTSDATNILGKVSGNHWVLILTRHL
jgi:hypothetical protein